MFGSWYFFSRGEVKIAKEWTFLEGGSYRMVLDSGGVVHADKIREVDTKIGGRYLYLWVDRGGISVLV